MIPLMSTKILREAAVVATFFVRPQASAKIAFFIEMALNDEIIQQVRALFTEKVTPLLVIVTASHGGRAHFDPEQLRFSQGPRSWQPRRISESLDIVPADYRQCFGGTLSGTDVQLGFILVPSWFDFDEPVSVHYGAAFLGFIPHGHEGGQQQPENEAGLRNSE